MPPSPNLRKIFVWLQLVRAPNGLTAVSNILAAAFIASHTPHLPSLVVLCLTSLCLYYAGMTLNDLLDFQEDLNERPNRPLPAKAISVPAAWTLCLALFALSLALASTLSLQTLYVSIALLLCIVLYDGLLKNGLAGAATMAMCRYGNWMLGLSLIPLSVQSWILPLPIFFYITALTYLSKQETRAENPNAMFVVAFLLGLCCAAIVAINLYFYNGNWIGLATVILFSAAIAQRLFLTFRDFTPENVQATVVWMIIGIIPLDALMAIAAGHYMIAVVILTLLPICRFLSKRLAMT